MIGYLQEENRTLREQLGGKRLWLTDRQRRRLAVKTKKVRRDGLLQTEPLMTPGTLLLRHRRLIVRKHDESKNRLPGRSRISVNTQGLTLTMARENQRWGYS